MNIAKVEMPETFIPPVKGVTPTDYFLLPGRNITFRMTLWKLLCSDDSFDQTDKPNHLTFIKANTYSEKKEVKNTFCNLYKLFSWSLTCKGCFLLFSTSVYSSLHLIPYKGQLTPGCAGHSLYNCVSTLLRIHEF